MRLFCTVAFALLFSQALAGEQKVYKCVNANGSVTFAPEPCGESAKEMNVPVTPRSTPPTAPPGAKDQVEAAAPSPKPAPKPQQNDAIRDISDGVADSNCRRDAQGLYREPDMSEIEGLEAEIKDLERSVWTVGGNGGSYYAQDLDQQDRVRAASLRGALATKQTQNETIRQDSRHAVQDALVRCDEKKREREKARESGG